MKKEIIAIAAVAVISGMTLASCGREVEQDSVSVALPKVTVASGEQATTTTGETTTGTKTTGTAVTGATTTTTATDDDDDTETTTTAEKEDETDETPVVEPTEKATEAPAVQQIASFGTGNLDQSISTITDTLGNVIYTTADADCIPKGDGENKLYIYEYSGIKFECYANNGSHCIYNIIITGSNYSTDTGIKVGDSKEAVISAYGEPRYDNGNMMYRNGSNVVYFVMNGDSVSEIHLNNN